MKRLMGHDRDDGFVQVLYNCLAVTSTPSICRTAGEIVCTAEELGAQLVETHLASTRKVSCLGTVQRALIQDGWPRNTRTASHPRARRKAGVGKSRHPQSRCGWGPDTKFISTKI